MPCFKFCDVFLFLFQEKQLPQSCTAIDSGSGFRADEGSNLAVLTSWEDKDRASAVIALHRVSATCVERMRVSSPASETIATIRGTIES
eukprot:172432-Rhodomonas_salina.2